ncbi:MAG: DUF2141 domain-containing protein [Rubrivivax sp.]|nr:DUF2141 domain-containing protein [Rubrivivax sp.]
MNTRCLISTVALLATAGSAHAEGQCADVEVHNVRPQQGQLMVAAYDAADRFGRQPLASLRAPAGDAVTTLRLCGLAGSEVALTLFQDLDGDGRMGRNAFGMPTEPWGASGSPGMMGPKWESTRVPLDGRVILVKLSV